MDGPDPALRLDAELNRALTETRTAKRFSWGVLNRSMAVCLLLELLAMVPHIPGLPVISAVVPVLYFISVAAFGAVIAAYWMQRLIVNELGARGFDAVKPSGTPSFRADAHHVLGGMICRYRGGHTFTAWLVRETFDPPNVERKPACATCWKTLD